MQKSSRRRAGWGSLSYDPKRKVGRIRYWAETPDGYRRVSETVRGTRKDCEERRSQLMLYHGRDVPCPTVAQAWDRWVLPTYERRASDGELSTQTLRTYVCSYNRHVEPRWGSVPCDQVRALAVQQWLLDGKTYEQARTGRNMLSAVLDFALRYEAVPSNVLRADYVMPPRSSSVARDKGVWDLAQLGEVWRHVRGSFIEPAFLLSAFGSCRVGESLAVMGSDVEGREACGVPLAVARVDKQVANKGRDVLRSTKTAASARCVVLAGRAATALLDAAAAAGDGYLTNDGVGRPVSQSVLNYQWKRLLPGELFHPFRNLRNSWQTNMRWGLGVAPWLIEPMMGHAGAGVTGQFYDRPQADAFCETMARAYLEHPYDADWSWLDL